ncbi:MFS transporter [Sutcliffiella cohnii]
MKLLNKEFAYMWFSNISTILSGRLREIVIPLLVLEMTGSPLKTGVVALALQLGSIIFAVPVGTWLERKSKIKVTIVSKSLTAVCMFLIAFIVFSGLVSAWLIAALLFVMGILSLVSRTAFTVLIPKVAGRKNLVEAHTKLEGADAICTLVGPALGGFLLAKIGAGLTLVVCGVLILLSLLFFVFIKEDDSQKEYNKNMTVKEKVNNFLAQSREGFKYLISNRPQIMSTIAFCVLSFSTVFVVLTVIIHSNTTMDLSAEYSGILLSSAGVGNILGVLFLGKLKNANWVPLLSLLMLISGFGVFIIFGTENFLWACLGMIIFDGALSMAFVIHSSVQQAITPNEVLSRIRSSTYVIGGIFTLLGTFLSGFIPEYFGTKPSLALGAFALLSIAIILWTNRGISKPMQELEPISM